jgi:rRNA maturation RNase YbeY
MTAASRDHTSDDVDPDGDSAPVMERPAALHVIDATAKASAAELATLRKRMREACEVIGQSRGNHQTLGGSISVRLVDDQEMATAHEEYLGAPGTTDVITFDLADPSEDFASQNLVEADLLVGLEVAKREAKLIGVPWDQEALLYIVHGVLHCLGHDDHDEEEAAQMHAEEDRVLTAMGLGAIYAAGRKLRDEGTIDQVFGTSDGGEGSSSGGGRP